EVSEALLLAVDAKTYAKLYADLADANPLWQEVPGSTGTVYAWDIRNNYIQEPPFFEGFSLQPSPVTDVAGARTLAIFGDSVTTDHISPAGAQRAGRAHAGDLGPPPPDGPHQPRRRDQEDLARRHLPDVAGRGARGI